MHGRVRHLAHCKSLASMTIPKSVTCRQFVTDLEIGRCLCTLQVFGEHDYPQVCDVHGRVRHLAHCKSLASMTIPKSVTCRQFVTDLEIVRCLCTLQVFGEHDYPQVCDVHGRVRHLAHCKSLASMTIPKSVTCRQFVTDLEIVRCLCTLQVFGEHDYPQVCDVHGRVRHLAHCKSLASMTIPKSVTNWTVRHGLGDSCAFETATAKGIKRPSPLPETSILERLGNAPLMVSW